MLTQDQVDQFHADGFLHGGPCLDDAQVDELRHELQRVIDDDGRDDVPQPAVLRNLQPFTDNPVWQVINIWSGSEAFRRVLSHPKITEEVAQLTGARELRVWHDQIQLKPAEVGGVAGWHQDAPLWPVLTPMEQVTAWIALDDVDEANGCMRMVPGSHHWGNHIWYLHELEGIDALPDTFEGHEVRAVPRPVRKGEVHYHHSLTWHASGYNRTGAPRRAFAIHYMPEHIRYVASEGHVIKHLIEVDDGEPIRGRHFPLCYTAPHANLSA